METAFLSHPFQMSSNPSWQTEFLSRPPAEVIQHFRTMPATSDVEFLRNYSMRVDLTPPPHGLYSPPPDILDTKGKSRMVELDDNKWEEQFRAFEESVKDDEANRAIDNELDMQESEQFFGDFESIWNGIQAEEAEREFSADEMGFLDKFKEEEFDWSDAFEDGKPDLGDYLFEPDNPFLQHERPFEEGVRLMENSGSLSEAALAFEAVCQLQPDNVKGWTYLGAVQAQNEKELAAIRALEQAIRLDESNLPALMVLLSYMSF